MPTSDVLARVLAWRRLLLVLDNCEHVIGAAVVPAGFAGLVRPHGAVGVGGSAALFVDRGRPADARFEIDGESGPLVAGSWRGWMGCRW